MQTRLLNNLYRARALMSAGIVWSLYFDSLWLFFVLTILQTWAKFVKQFLKRDRGWPCRFKKITYGLLLYSLGYMTAGLYDATDPWYFYFIDGPNIAFYVAALFYAAASFFKILQAAKARRGTSYAIYRIRKFLYNTYVACAFCMSSYYIAEVIFLMEENNVQDIATTTAYTNKTIKFCEDTDKRDEMLLNLYDTTEFSLDCSFDIWRRNRINLLSWLQVKIVFALTWQLTHVKEKFLHGSPQPHSYSALANENVKELLTLKILLCQIFKCFMLFFAVTLWFDDVRQWYIIPLSSCVLFTIYFVADEYRPL